MRISGWQGCGDDVVRGGSIDNSVVDGFSDVVIEINCCSRLQFHPSTPLKGGEILLDILSNLT
jgi:hypothetical protein